MTMRIVKKAARDLLVGSVVGQVLLAAIGFVTALAGVPGLGIDPVLLAKAVGVLTAALAVYRLAREHFGPLLRIDPR